MDKAPWELQVPLEETGHQANLEAYWACIRDVRDLLKNVDRVVSDGRGGTQELRAAQANLQRIVHDEADRPALVRDAIERLNSAYDVNIKESGNGSVFKIIEE